eukprot:TRINITY_DN2925_c0_g1_i1.p1 TRINITY_DN2925_c0_g1~~TRINITY_DN2925_c0_g1_i1.p1  ORF type:complete len:220 (+),score=12.76 TRINITY_DN2925_c0_g1_i1:72-731(+)
MGQKDSKSKPYRILAMGDSLTWGYYNRGRNQHSYCLRLHSRLKEIFNSEIIIENHGVSGNTTHQMLDRLPGILDAAAKEKNQYKLMILLGGTNDMGEKKPDLVLENLLKLHAMAAERGIETFAMTIPRYQKEKDLPWLIENRTKINTALRDKFSGRFVDLEEGIALEGADADGKSYWDDVLQFSPQGYDRMADLIYDALCEKFKSLNAAEDASVKSRKK